MHPTLLNSDLRTFVFSFLSIFALSVRHGTFRYGGWPKIHFMKNSDSQGKAHWVVPVYI